MNHITLNVITWYVHAENWWTCSFSTANCIYDFPDLQATDYCTQAQTLPVWNLSMEENLYHKKMVTCRPFDFEWDVQEHPGQLWITTCIKSVIEEQDDQHRWRMVEPQPPKFTLGPEQVAIISVYIYIYIYIYIHTH